MLKLDHKDGDQGPESVSRLRIVPLHLRAANDFVERWHRHSARTARDGGKFAIGLEYRGALVGVAIVGRPTARLLQQNQPYAAELLRLCTAPDCPKGGASKLYARARRIWQLMGGTHFHTYTLARESGASLRGAGLKEAPGLVPAAVWTRPCRPRRSRSLEAEAKLHWSEQLPLIAP
jgi:hypothetical protein